MSTKLTLTIDDNVISTAKKYAQRSGKSLSNLVETYLRSISDGSEEQDAVSPRVKKLMGVIKLPANFDYKSEISKAMTEKFVR